jgi:hypothetical protein
MLDPLNAFLDNALAGFVVGHEVGHIVSRRPGPLGQTFAAVDKCWSDHKSKAWTWGEGPSTNRYVVPSIIQKLDDNGMPAGNLSQSTTRMGAMDRELQNALAECKADCLGLLVCSQLGSKVGLRPDMLIHMLIHTLRAVDRYSTMRKIIPQLPRNRRRGSVDFDYPRVASRLYLLIQMVLRIVDGTIPVPPEVAAYWQHEPEALECWRSGDAEKYIAHITMGNDAVARGGVYLGTGAQFPNSLPTDADLIEEYGEILGPVQMPFYWPFRMPSDTYEIERHWDWTPKGVQPGVIGYASAVKDITRVLLDASPIRDECGVNYRRKVERGSAVLPLIRHVRRLIEAQSLVLDH